LRSDGTTSYSPRMSENPREDVQQFHRWSRTYERSIGQPFLFDPVHRRVIRLVAGQVDRTAPACVLDIGCGTGRLLRRAGRRWPEARLLGLDPAEGMIERARVLTPTAEFLNGQGEEIPLPDSSVDVAFSTISFHHWEDQAKGVREVARILRPRGLFCLADGTLPEAGDGLVRHSRIHTRREMLSLFAQAGLTVVLQRGILAGFVAATIGSKG
jgi:ubiquinone/menaquinone biosynthesis C-methylase UbiE